MAKVKQPFLATQVLPDYNLALLQANIQEVGQLALQYHILMATWKKHLNRLTAFFFKLDEIFGVMMAEIWITDDPRQVVRELKDLAVLHIQLVKEYLAGFEKMQWMYLTKELANDPDARVAVATHYKYCAMVLNIQFINHNNFQTTRKTYQARLLP